MRGKHGKEGCFDKKNEDVGHQQIGVKKEISLLSSVVVPSGKRREELGSSKDRSRKNRIGALDKEGDMSLKSLHASAESVFTSASDGKPVEFYEDRSSKSFMNDSQGTKNMNLMDASLQRCGSLEYDAVSSGAEKPKDSLEGSLEALSCDTSNVNFPVGFGSKERKHGPVAVPVVDSSAKVIASSALEHTRVEKLLVKLEGDGILNVNPENNMEVSAASDLRPPNNKLPSAAEEVKMKQIDVSGGTYPSSSSVRPIIKVEVHGSNSRGVLNGVLGQNMPENSNKNGVASSCLPDHREQESDKISEDVEKKRKMMIFDLQQVGMIRV
ncbi:hypothetical protein K2173_025372 [Erythroxylum novogranatense]|uniref:Uncharacterized protein n=1 Tax=Erythroxylum novogranatense TaxID=1862640 RepID=A0AAV8UDM5_9ROSI|nr:hypothetical protein K2173_025372 [Erythroxylum novogranatense]